MLYTSELQKSCGLPLPAECLRQSTEGSMLRKKMIRSNLLRDRGCIFSCQQLMKQECQLTGESKSGQKKGGKKIVPLPSKATALIEVCDEKRKFMAATDGRKGRRDLTFNAQRN